MAQFNVIGAKESTVNNSNVSGINYAGNKIVDRSVKAGDVSGNLSTGENTRNSIGEKATPRDPSDINSAELVVMLTKHECSEDTINKFREKSITGDIFVSDLEEILKLLDIKNDIDKMKLRKIVKGLKS